MSSDGSDGGLDPETLLIGSGYDPQSAFGAGKRGRLRITRMAVDLESTESRICRSATTTHDPLPAEIRREVGVDGVTLRFSIGMELPEDLVADLQQAMEAV